MYVGGYEGCMLEGMKNVCGGYEECMLEGMKNVCWRV